jgi:class 3 adenylate cyclase
MYFDKQVHQARGGYMAWRISVSEPNTDSRVVELKKGKTTIGRNTENDIVLHDIAASRFHAEITFDESKNLVSITDLNSTNGTYLNRQRVNGQSTIRSDDSIRIGQAIIHVFDETKTEVHSQKLKGTTRFTRELLLESLDEHAVLLYEISKRLNTITDLQAAMSEVRDMMKRTLSIDNCLVIHHKEFPNLASILPNTAALNAVQNQSVEVTATNMIVPVVGGDETLGLMYFSKTRPGTRPFSRRDLQLAIAISHQVALTIQRMELIEKLREQQYAQELLRRFVPPDEAEYLIADYLRTGKLPGLRQAKVSILFSDMAGSTALAEQVGSNAFAEILNRYYQEATGIIFKHGGTVRYLGDGIMAIFEDRQHHNLGPALAEQRAVSAGAEILRKISAIDFGNNLNIVIGVAVHTGQAMVGYIGSNERMEFNALGDTVNVAFRMQELARPNRLVVGPATMAAIVNQYQTRRIGAVTLKGREKPIQAYEILQNLEDTQPS